MTGCRWGVPGPGQSSLHPSIHVLEEGPGVHVHPALSSFLEPVTNMAAVKQFLREVLTVLVKAMGSH